MSGRVRASSSAKRRRSELAKIHIAEKQLFRSKEEYRDMLESMAGVRSAADLDAAGRGKVLDHLSDCGAVFKPARKSGHKRKPARAPVETERQIRKIRAMLADDGLPDSYAEAILKRMTKHPHRVPLVWANGEQLRNVIAALEYRRARLEERSGRPA